MKTCIAGDGSDSTAAVQAWLAAGNELRLATLYLIGEIGDPQALWLTDWETPLLWSVCGTFLPAVITRGNVTSKIGFEVQNLELNWSPKRLGSGVTIATANPYQLARIGYCDNWRVRCWTVYMPTPGDANTFGCSELWGGRIADITIAQGKITFKTNSFLDVVNQHVPTNVIELQNTAAAYGGAHAPAGFSTIPQCNVITGSSTNVIVGDCTNIGPHQVFDTNALRGGFLVFNPGPGSTLQQAWAAIQQNTRVTVSGVDYNQFVLYASLPWPPTPFAAGVGDTFFVSAPNPINQADGEYLGFPYLPNPESAF